MMKLDDSTDEFAVLHSSTLLDSVSDPVLPEPLPDLVQLCPTRSDFERSKPKVLMQFAVNESAHKFDHHLKF